MPQRVVDVLEIVQVEKQQPDLLLVPLGQPDRVGEPFCQQEPVGQAGKKIMLGQMGISSAMARDSLTS